MVKRRGIKELHRQASCSSRLFSVLPEYLLQHREDRLHRWIQFIAHHAHSGHDCAVHIQVTGRGKEARAGVGREATGFIVPAIVSRDDCSHMESQWGVVEGVLGLDWVPILILSLRNLPPGVGGRKKNITVEDLPKIQSWTPTTPLQIPNSADNEIHVGWEP